MVVLRVLYLGFLHVFEKCGIYFKATQRLLKTSQLLSCVSLMLVNKTNLTLSNVNTVLSNL